jgi:hypothetical protein
VEDAWARVECDLVIIEEGREVCVCVCVCVSGKQGSKEERMPLFGPLLVGREEDERDLWVCLCVYVCMCVCPARDRVCRAPAQGWEGVGGAQARGGERGAGKRVCLCVCMCVCV